jgi:putative SOS response-associated peptidase YedK
MCNLYEYEMTPEMMASIKRHFTLVGTAYLDALRGRNTAVKVYPNKDAPVIRLVDGQHTVEEMRWGFTPWKGNWLTNTRDPALKTWRDWFGKEQRCLVPVRRFSEYDDNTPKGAKVLRWFERPNGEPFFFAGIWRPWTGDRGTKAAPDVRDWRVFSFLTTEANAVVAPIHKNAMPVLLTTSSDVEQWLQGTPEEALRLQKPANDDALVLMPLDDKAA